MNNYDVVMLGTLLDQYDQDKVSEVLHEFTTGTHGKDVEDFLHDKAIEFEKLSIARTYLIFLSNDLVGYFSISSKSLDIPATQWNELGNKTRRNLAGKLSQQKISADATKSITGVLLGQLGRDAKYKHDVEGADILSLAELAIKDVWRAVGGRFIWLEADQEETLTGFYERGGYIRITGADGKTLLNQRQQNFFIKMFN
jgi:hypothetical protein